MKRYLEVKPPVLIPNHHFAMASSECRELYKDGHFYGCISLTQSVAEGIVRYLVKNKANKYKVKENYQNNLNILFQANVISDLQKNTFEHIYEDRNLYHHLSFNVSKDRIKLQKLAKEKLLLLNEIENDLFAFSISEGKIVPKNHTNWNIKRERTEIYLRID
jgi:hypothetical protein